MAVVQQGLKSFTTVVFDDYSAKKYGNSFLVTSKDSSVQAMEMDEFKKISFVINFFSFIFDKKLPVASFL